MKPTDPAFPYAFQHEDASRFVAAGFAPGISVRAHFAALAMQGLLASEAENFCRGNVYQKADGTETSFSREVIDGEYRPCSLLRTRAQDIAKESVEHADALIAEINKTAPVEAARPS